MTKVLDFILLAKTPKDITEFLNNFKENYTLLPLSFLGKPRLLKPRSLRDETVRVFYDVADVEGLLSDHVAKVTGSDQWWFKLDVVQIVKDHHGTSYHVSKVLTECVVRTQRPLTGEFATADLFTINGWKRKK